MHLVLIVLISFFASVVGAIAGIGGGVIIKPVMDSLGIMEVATISFLSGCTVLSMSAYNAGKSLLSGDRSLKKEIALPLGLGAALGGVFGKNLFSYILSLFENASRVGAVQSACLTLITILTFVYTIKPTILPSLRIKNPILSALNGLLLGVISAFLGIGGGPINLMALSVLYSMNMKEAAQNSLMVIFLSQLASLISTLVTRSVPDFDILMLVLMAGCGILGGVAGRKANQKLSGNQVRIIFLIAMALIILLSIRNFFSYLGS